MLVQGIYTYGQYFYISLGEFLLQQCGFTQLSGTYRREISRV